MRHEPSLRVEWKPGPIGDAVAASLEGRLKQFIRDEESETVALYSPEAKAVSDSGDWYGEHLGKWMIGAHHAWQRTGDAELGEALERVVAYVVAQQEPDGYLGTYRSGAPCRFTSVESEEVRTWDLWTHAWTILGLLKAGRTEAAASIGDLILTTFGTRTAMPLDLGNHAGLSSSVVIEPLAELTLATGDDRYAAFALEIVEELERRLGFLSKADVAEIGTGKAYQILWNLLGLVALYRATGQPRLLETAESLWTNVEAHHLTPTGGPWGGIAAHKEVFNAKGFFSPYGMVETCSAATWMALSRELFRVTGKARYVEAFERTLMNSLLGALDENGADWIYFTFPNGRRNNTYHWACCKSSGAMALEESSDMVATHNEAGVSVNLLFPCRVKTGHAQTSHDGVTLLIDETSVEVGLDAPRSFGLSVRIPSWAVLNDVSVAGEPVERPELVDGYLRIDRVWKSGDRVELSLDQPIRVVPYTDTVDHHGQEIVRMDYAYVTRGPYVFAAGLIDGYKKEETLRLPRLTPESPFRVNGDGIDLHMPGRAPIHFLPYYRAGGRHEGAWRTTWLQIAWQ
jgi:uncharacterized protein